MRLATREWGTGTRTAVLVHGLMSDHRTWHRVGPALAGLGYRVVAVDLRGHGDSPRADAYSPLLFAEDLVETVPAGADVVLGHSLGGLLVSLVADRLAPRRAVYSDPAWSLANPARTLDAEVFRQIRLLSRTALRLLNPRWDDVDLDTELASIAATDPATVDFLRGRTVAEFFPGAPAVPSLVQLPETSTLTGPAQEARLAELGYEVRRVPGTGHCLHRDDLDAFVTSLDGWV